MTDWRTPCEELLDELLARPLIPDRALIDRARATLAQPEPEVVELTDEDCWQWYTYRPEEGLEMYPNREQAQSAAQGIMGSYEVAAHSDGFHEDMESVSWGMLVPVEQAQVVERKTADPDDELDEWVEYELRPVRRGRPAPAPDDRGVLPMIVSETGADDEPELERIICASISGGADYVNSMPRELRLERITPEGSTFARYIQVDADARPDVRPAPAPAEGEVAKLVQPPGRAGLTWQGVIEGLRDVLNDESEDAIQCVWQRSRILDAISVMEANPCPAPVAVAVDERPWKREGWCHPQERWAWFYNRRVGWRDAIPPESLKPPTLFPYTHSLPFNALPLPGNTESGGCND